MRNLRRIFLPALFLAAVGASMLAGTGTGVGQDAYPESGIIGGASISPQNACIGQEIFISGQGMPAGAEVSVYLMSASGMFGYTKRINTPDGPIVMAVDGFGPEFASEKHSTLSDAAGNWSLTMIIPTTIMTDHQRSSSPMFADEWQIWAQAQDNDLIDYIETGTLTVRDCNYAPLPSTGFTLAPALCVLASLAVSGGAILRLRNSRR